MARNIWREGHQHRLVVDQQRVRAGVVGAQWFAVKGAGVAGHRLKSTVVEHDVALDARNANALHTAQQQPQALEHQLGVALALDVDIAYEHPGTHRALHIHRRGPGVGRAQQVECGVGGHQLHHRRGLHGYPCTVA